MMAQLSRVLLAVTLLAMGAPAFAVDPPLATDAEITKALNESPDLDVWLDRLVKARLAGPVVRTAIENTASVKEVTAPSASTNSSSLIDRSSVSDLAGIALNLAGLTGSSASGSDPTSVSATVSGYAFYAAVQGIDPLSPKHYCKPAARRARAVSMTLGYDNNDDASTASKTGQSIIIGVKVGIWPGLIEGNDACSADLSSVYDALVQSTTAYANLSPKAQDQLAALANVPYSTAVEKVAFLNTLGSPATFMALLGKSTVVDGQPMLIGDALQQWALEGPLANESGLKPFKSLGQATRRSISEIQNGHRVSFSFNSKQRSGDKTDDYDVSLIWDTGIADHLTFTGNAAFNMEDVNGAKNRFGGTVAANFQYTPRLPDQLWGSSPIRLNMSGMGKWMSNTRATYKGQLSLRIPLPWGALQGLELPISLTVANRTELIDETDVRGMIGFSIDTSQLFGLLDPLKPRP